MSNQVIIDFANLGGPVYAGRPKGEKARAELELDRLDAAGTLVQVKIPPDTYSLNSSYFLGMFGKSVVHAGSRERFYQQYSFDAPDFVLKEIDADVGRALIESRPL